MTEAVANTLWARSIVDELARCGLREVVVAPGSRSTPLVMAFARDERVRARVHLDERSASFFALGIGKATGRPAAVLTTSGTAVANLLPAVVEAAQSGVPLIVLSADRPRRLRGADANQTIDQVGIFGSFVRDFHDLAPPSAEGRALRHLRSVIARAYAFSIGDVGGPVHLNVPFDKPLEPSEPLADVMAADPMGRWSRVVGDPSASGGRPGGDSTASEGRSDGRPYTVVEEGRRLLPDGVIERLAASIDVGRGVLIVGPSEGAPAIGAAVRRFGAITGFPVLADPLSGARFGPFSGSCVVAGYDLFLRDEVVREWLAPSCVVRVAAAPTSAALQRWLAGHDQVPQVVIDGGGRWKDHGATATHYLAADPSDTLERLADHLASGPRGGASREWVGRWTAAADATLAALDADACAGDHEGHLAATVISSLPAGATLFVSSSMPIRDVDAFGRPREAHLRVLSNRGASGIDGVVSSAFGVASQVEGPTVCLIGDVAFFHDRNGLLWSRESDAPVVFVVVDNDGGGIFHMLPIADHEPEFTRFFGTPHGIDPRHAAAAHGIAYRDVDAAGLARALGAAHTSGETTILRVLSDRDTNRRRHAEVAAAVARSVRGLPG